MKKSRIVSYIFLLLFCIIVTVLIIYKPEKSYSAGSGTVSYSNVNINLNETKKITVKLSSASDVQAVGGYYSIDDPSCIQVLSVTPGSGVKMNNNKFALTSMDEIPSGSTILTLEVKGLKECSTKISFSECKVTSTESVNSLAQIVSGKISVSKPQETTTKAPQQNNNNNNTGTSTNTSTNNNPKRTTTSTKPVSTKAGSGNNNLSELSVDGYSIQFNKNTTEYSITVPETVESVKVNAKTEDKKANAKISGNTQLVNGDNVVKVLVEAENGSLKTYIIYVFREGEVKGDEVKKSEDNSLSSITSDIGTLSPKFSKDVYKYILYLPYENDKIALSAIPSDSKATVETDKIEELTVGANVFNIKVTAENGNEALYSVVVMRGINPKYIDSDNVYLESINIENGKLIGKFDKEKRDYYYSKKSGIIVTPKAEDENSTVSMIEYKGVYYIKVEAPNGNFSVYTLRPYSIIYSIWFYIVLVFVGFILGIFFKKILKKMCK